MVGNLDLFYRFYQTCETAQCIDLSKDADQYLLPDTHPAAAKIREAAQDLDQRARTKVSQLQNTLYTIHDAPDWLIRGAHNTVSRPVVQNAMGSESSDTLRVVMNRRLKKVVLECELDVVIPDEYLVNAPDPNRRANSKVTWKDFFVTSEKLDIFNKSETIRELSSFSLERQKVIADTICRLIYYSGYMDARMDNIVLTRDGHLAVVDTEGVGLFHNGTEPLFSPTSLSHARIVGLKEFISQANHILPDVYTQTAKRWLFYVQVMHVVKIAAILFSIICPLLPLIVLVSSVAYAKLHNTSHTPTDAPDPVFRPLTEPVIA